MSSNKTKTKKTLFLKIMIYIVIRIQMTLSGLNIQH